MDIDKKMATEASHMTQIVHDAGVVALIKLVKELQAALSEADDIFIDEWEDSHADDTPDELDDLTDDEKIDLANTPPVVHDRLIHTDPLAVYTKAGGAELSRWEDFAARTGHHFGDNFLVESYPITSLSRADIDGLGYDSSKLDNPTFERMAGKLGDRFVAYGNYWDDLREMCKTAGLKYDPAKDTQSDDFETDDDREDEDA